MDAVGNVSAVVRYAALLAVLGGGFLGCSTAPDAAPWNPDQETIVSKPPPALGYLIVETQESGSPENGEQPHERFHVYDQSGRYVTYFRNDQFLPVGLSPGRYVVVSRYSGKNKRVQVEIKEGCRASVSLEDIRKAPAIE